MEKLVIAVMVSWFTPVGALVSQGQWWDYGYHGTVPRYASRVVGIVDVNSLPSTLPIRGERYLQIQRQAAEEQIKRMIAAGIDGVLFDMLPRTNFDPKRFSKTDMSTHPTENFGLLGEWLAAAHSVSEKFKVGLFVDVRQQSAENPKGAVPPPQQWADIIAALVDAYGSNPSLLRLDGKPAVFHFGTSSTALPGNRDWSGGWTDVLRTLRNRGISIYFVSDVRPQSDQSLKRWLALSDAVQLFAPGAPLTFGTEYQDRMLQLARSAGKEYVWSVYPGYYVPAKWYSPPSFERYHQLWTAAIHSGARIVQVLTWNDVNEATDIWWGGLNSDVRLKLTKFYAEAFRRGAIQSPQSPQVYIACPVQIDNRQLAVTANWPKWKQDRPSTDTCFYWGAYPYGNAELNINGVGTAAIGKNLSMGVLGVVTRVGPLEISVRTDSGKVYSKLTRPILSGAHLRENLNYFYEEITIDRQH
jgi:hypothetical protein